MEDRYNVECCDFIHAHEGIVEQVRKTLPGEDTLYDLTELFRIFDFRSFVCASTVVIVVFKTSPFAT